MNRYQYLSLFLIGLVVGLITANYQDAPGYMDADYYFAGGLRLAEGEGFSELVLWNYLDDPQGIPHPSHAYWLPLASIISWIGLKISVFQNQFKAAQAAFILILAFIPPLTAKLSYSITKSNRLALVAGILACFPAYYLPFLTTPDTFGLYMLLGSVFLLLLGQEGNGIQNKRNGFLLGLVVGLMHLARQDGILWLGVAALAITSPRNKENSVSNRQRLAALGRIILGYLIVMGPWLVRNVFVFGSPQAPGGLQTLWLTEYNELFSYPASSLTLEHWLQSGFGHILGARLWALGQNLQITLAVQGSIFLLPLILLGAWDLRSDKSIRFACLGWMLTFIVMTLFFPFSGVRGGFFHSGAAVQPLFWAMAPVGLKKAISWANQMRGWNIHTASYIFHASIIIFAFGLTSIIFTQRFLGIGESPKPWGASEAHYSDLEQVLQENGALPGDVVLVKNPPGYFAATERAAIVIPNGNLETLLTVAQRYSARFVLLEADHTVGLDGLYENPANHPGLQYLGVFEDTHLFRLEISPQE
ncbi:MAG: hypothetical protein FVQ83_07990 [Chloroflexi bacterium]|nr:hypothetical protein [Chloroflexota bacterium]